MKRAILAVSAALLLLASAPAQADGFRSKHHGFGHYAERGHHVKPHHFGGHRHKHHMRSRHFRGFAAPPHLSRHYFKRHHFGRFDHRPHFWRHDRRHGGRHFGRRQFRGHGYGYRH